MKQANFFYSYGKGVKNLCPIMLRYNVH